MKIKKTLSENDIKELANEQLSKVSGGFATGDTCPACDNGILVYDRNYDVLYCTKCLWDTSGNSIIRQLENN